MSPTSSVATPDPLPGTAAQAASGKRGKLALLLANLAGMAALVPWPGLDPATACPAGVVAPLLRLTLGLA